MAKRFFLIMFSTILLVVGAKAQQKPYQFTGLGRAIVANSKINGNAYDQDTASATAGTGGYTLFDLGVHVQPLSYLKGTAVIRLKNQFGAFFGEGTSLDVRQLTLNGLIGKKVHYVLGDIDVQMTPYTVFNNIDTTEFESEIFSTRRGISFYENFNVGNNWRVQGGKIKSILLINNDLGTITTQGFISRTRANDFVSLPDRFLGGASALANIKEQLSIGVNYATLFEVKDQVDEVAQYNNQVITGTVGLKHNFNDLIIGFSAESGYSSYNRTDADTSTRTANDIFYDAELNLDHAQSGLKLLVKYSRVGTNFYSPGAQTLRINNANTPTLFADISNAAASREQIQFDRITQSNLYNPTIMSELMYFLPQYGNLEPFGDATPNRSGLTIQASYEAPKKWLKLNLKGKLYSESSAATGNEKRQFIAFDAGGNIRIGQALDLNKQIDLVAGYSIENTNRDSPDEIDFAINKLDVGLKVETVKDLFILFGLKQLQASGNEYLNTRNEFNDIETSNAFDLDITQTHLAWGIQYEFSEKTYFSVNGNYVGSKDRESNLNDYNITQYFVNYTLQF